MTIEILQEKLKEAGFICYPAFLGLPFEEQVNQIEYWFSPTYLTSPFGIEPFAHRAVAPVIVLVRDGEDDLVIIQMAIMERGQQWVGENMPPHPHSPDGFSAPPNAYPLESVRFIDGEVFLKIG